MPIDVVDLSEPSLNQFTKYQFKTLTTNLDGQTKTYEQIGELCGISRESVRKIKNKVLRLLKRRSAEFSYRTG